MHDARAMLLFNGIVLLRLHRFGPLSYHWCAQCIASQDSGRPSRWHLA